MRNGRNRTSGPGVRGEEPSDDLVILLDAQPVGLLQRSQIGDYPEEVERFSTLVDIPPGAIEFDYLIADPARRGRGPGTRLIEMAVARSWIDHLARLPCSSRSCRRIDRPG